MFVACEPLDAEIFPLYRTLYTTSYTTYTHSGILGCIRAGRCWVAT